MRFYFQKKNTYMVRLNILLKTLFHCLLLFLLLFHNMAFSQNDETISDAISHLILEDTLFVTQQEQQLVINKVVKDANDAKYSDNSVLSSGKWYKIALDKTGIYKITYSDLVSWGIPVASINARNIRIYHNGGSLVPVINSEPRYDDLVEIPVFVSSGNEKFGENDYILFYARGPVVWQYDSSNAFYEHVKNPYSENSFAFLNFDLGEGKRLQYAEEPTGSTIQNTVFLDGKVVEEDLYNLNNMGKTWYFDLFDIVLSRNYDFSFPDINTSKPSKLRMEVASRNFSTSYFSLKYKGELIDRLSFNSISNSNYDYALHKSTNVISFNAVSSDISLELTYSRTMSSSTGWLDYIEVNSWRNLVFSGSMMSFRNPECNDASSVYEYVMSNVSGNVQVWDVTNPVEPVRLNADIQSSTLKFKVNGDIDNEFIAFNGQSFYAPKYVGEIQNQNLHAKRDIDYLIIVHPDFYQQAQRLKELHALIDDLVIDIVTPDVIYNEFSCGALDIAAIRDYIKMLHDRSSAGHKLKYVLLFGDASYDYRNKSGKVCFVPTYESVASCNMASSKVTDDFFVCIDDNEGNMEDTSSICDIAIGRIPVSTSEQAEKMVNKIESYISKGKENMRNWRNMMTLICDDEENSNSFLTLSERIQDTVKALGAEMVFDKIYLPAYTQVATSNGQRSPETNEAITNRFERGSLIINYIGHGGEVGWADERILTLEDINGLQNYDMLPLVVTATCEFSRFDDHTRTSAGEYLYLNEHGGAISMVTTARLAQSSPSQLLLYRFYKKLFDREPDGQMPRLGDAYLAAKQNSSSNTKLYVFFGDPALHLAYPENNIELLSVNDISVEDGIDTLKALKQVSMKGAVKDYSGNVMDDFNGIVYVSVYDKENEVQTQGSDSPQTSFKINNSLIFNGKTEVVNGLFTVNFTVPKDINYSYGKGLISFYATDYYEDAIGISSNIIVGGYDNTAIPDESGPETRIFIDDTLFVNGMKTNENPVFYAYIKDTNGINTTGAGIGHDITVQLTGATNKTYNLNQYYEYPLNTDSYGNVIYKFYNLNEGVHYLKFRVWDIYNNSTTKELTFNVVKSSNISLDNLMNYPNPMKTSTSFVFEHNQKDNEIGIVIRIYNIKGQLVRTIKESRYGSTLRIEPIYWDGCSDNGAMLPSGIYIYNVTVTNERQETMIGYSKLIISR